MTTITPVPAWRNRPPQTAAITAARKAVETARWQLLSLLTAEVVARDGPQCHYCGVLTVQRTAIATDPNLDRTVDHKVPVDRGGKDEFDNLVLACRACNSAKGTLPYEVFLAQRRPLRIHVQATGIRQSQQVEHSVFGRGIVVQVNGSDAVVAFSNGGRKAGRLLK